MNVAAPFIRLPDGTTVPPSEGIAVPAGSTLVAPGTISGKRPDGAPAWAGVRSGVASLTLDREGGYRIGWSGGPAYLRLVVTAPWASSSRLHPFRLMLPFVDGTVSAPALVKVFTAVAPLRCRVARSWCDELGRWGQGKALRAAGFGQIYQTWTFRERGATHDLLGYLRGLDAAVSALHPDDVVQWGNELYQIRKYLPLSIGRDARGWATLLEFLRPLSQRIGAKRLVGPSYLPEMDYPDLRVLKSIVDAGLVDPGLVSAFDVHCYFRASWSQQQIVDRLSAVRAMVKLPLISTETGPAGTGTTDAAQTPEMLRQLDGIQQVIDGPISLFGFLGTGGKWDAAYPPVVRQDGTVARAGLLAALAARAKV